MKKNFFILFISCLISMSFISCSQDSDTEWRDENLAYIDKIGSEAGINVLGDSINGYPGIFYKVIEKGSGERPVRGNVVNVSYEGWLYNDTVSFDSDDDYDFTLGTDVIEGWNLVVENMHAGDKWRVYIPYNLGYGTSANTSGSIPAYSTLIFDIKLNNIVSDN
jgi:hypothetical protein